MAPELVDLIQIKQRGPVTICLCIALVRSGSAIPQNLLHNLRTPSRPRRQTRFLPPPTGSPSSRESPATRRFAPSKVTRRAGWSPSAPWCANETELYFVPKKSVIETIELEGTIGTKARVIVRVRAGAGCAVHPRGYALANRGHDTRALQAYLGHKNIQHTVRYTELSPTRFKDFWRA